MYEIGLNSNFITEDAKCTSQEIIKIKEDERSSVLITKRRDLTL